MGGLSGGIGWLKEASSMVNLTCEVCGEVPATERIKVGVYEFDACRSCAWNFIRRMQQKNRRARS